MFLGEGEEEEEGSHQEGETNHKKSINIKHLEGRESNL